MAERKTTPPKPKFKGYLVNPAGAIHSVSKEHARVRLASVGWRLPTDEELAQYQNQAVQRFDAPIATPYRQEVDEALAGLDESEA